MLEWERFQSGVEMTVVAITGHRPEDLGGESGRLWVREALNTALKELEPSVLIQGMAAGVDLDSAVVAWHLDIPYIAMRPWAGHSPRTEDQQAYDWVLRHAVEVVNCNDSMSYLGPWVYHDRNHAMIDRADYVLAVWTGKKSGGTFAAVKYAREKEKRVYVIDPQHRKILGWEDQGQGSLL